MTFGLWQAHLALALLLFLLVAPLGTARHWQVLKLAGAAGLTFLPVDGLPLAILVRSFTHDLSSSLLVLLAGLTLARLGAVQVRADHLRDLLLAFAVLTLVLYPASLGLSYLDPYRWGYEPTWLLLAMAVLTFAFLLRGNGLGAAMLLIATLAYALRGEGPGNYWNYLIDPLLALYAWVFCLKWAGAALLRRVRSFLHGERTARRPTDLAETDR
ncbi:hypothetical protein HNP46_005217 [Pseudomonas nitritireducens]|uniref:Uncharacterized protein n=1 Tax=Pseudomonas nitroreducens TaxID=46680 RepID=A0A7W7KNZ5_PSENT|nr:hypothetical protein [Pseudomonas nitritireducens]MBB4866312.1 hypothetical protein [Pseudomonas nitritireducens]